MSSGRRVWRLRLASKISGQPHLRLDLVHLSHTTFSMASNSGSAAETPPQASSSTAQTTPKPKTELKGFRVALANTGIPHSVLTWKPRLPSRNWSIFLTVVGTVTYLYYDDRRKCKQIKEEYIRRVEHLAKEPLATSLDEPRRVKVIAAKWPEDDDDDRAARYFRKYIKVGLRVRDMV